MPVSRPCATSDLHRPVCAGHGRSTPGAVPLHRFRNIAGVAAGYVDAIVAHCEGLAVFPHRGTMRDDIRPGLRTSSYKKRAVIATFVDDEARQVSILGVLYGGHDYDTILSGSDNG